MANARGLWSAILLVFSTGCAHSEYGRSFEAFSRNAGADYRSHAATMAPEVSKPTAAEPALTEGSGLNEYLAYAAANSPQLEAAFNRWRAALQKVPQAKALPDPRLSYRFYVREVETRVGPMRQGAGLSQMLPWFGKLDLRGSAAAEEANAERRRFEAAALKLFARVKTAYCEYYYLRRRTEVLRENLRLLQRVEEVARIRYKTAAADHPAIVRTQVELGKLEDRLRSLVSLRGPLAARLNAALNRPADAKLPWPEALPEDRANFTDEQALVMLPETNPELLAMDAQTTAWRHRVQLAKKDYYPDVTLGVDYVDIETPSGRPRAGDAGKDAVAVMASVNLPIWREKLDAGLREARHRRLAAVLQRHQRAKDLQADLKLALHHYRDAGRKASLYRGTLLPKAIESVRVTESAFRAGTASFADLLDAQRVLLEFSLAAERAAVDRAIRLAEIESLVGRPMPPAQSVRTATAPAEK